MAKDSLTPEEKLLKIIENPNIEKRSLPLSSKVRSLGAGTVKDLLARFHIDKNLFKKFNFRTINIIIAGICIIVTLVWLLSFIRSGMVLAGRFRQITADAGASVQESQKKPKIEVNIEEALAQVKKRNVFTLLPSKEQAQASVDIGLTLGNLKLVGILWSDNPQAMIENSKEQKTYFVSKGDKIGDIEVRSILRDKVIVGKGAEEWELR